MADQNTGKLTIGYIRCSSVTQVRDGETLDRQQTLIGQYCQLKGIENLLILKDEAISGYKSNRPAYQELKKLCLANQVETVIVTDLSRLSRSVRETLEFIDDIITKNTITFVSLSQNIDTSTAMGKCFLSISAVFNQHYRDTISERTCAAWEYKRKKKEKIGRFLSYGYDLSGKTLTLNANEQKVIQSMKELKEQGFTYTDIARELKNRNIPTKNGRPVWHHNTIRDVLHRLAQSTELKVAA